MKYFKYLDGRINMDNIIGYHCLDVKMKVNVKHLYVFWGRVLIWKWGGEEKVLYYIKFIGHSSAKALFLTKRDRDDCLLELDKYVKPYKYQDEISRTCGVTEKVKRIK